MRGGALGATAWEVASEYQSDPLAAILHIALISFWKIRSQAKNSVEILFKKTVLNTEYQSDPPAAILHIAIISF